MADMFVRPRPKKSILPPPKRRRTTSAIEEISFDFEARADYLTGFHKRKVQRAKQAQLEAVKKAKEERIVMRRQLREERRQELVAHVEAVNALLVDADVPGLRGEVDSDPEAWGGIEEDVEPIDHEAEYVDEDRYTTVTVEEVDVDKEGIHRTIDEEEQEELAAAAAKVKAEVAAKMAEEDSKKKVWPKKERKPKFRYESKAERKFTRGKQKAGNKAKAGARRGEE